MRHLLYICIIVGIHFDARCQGDPTKVKVLYLGDHCSLRGLGPQLDARLRSHGVQLHTYIDGAASPYHWLKTYQPFTNRIGFWEKSPTSTHAAQTTRKVPKLEDLMVEISPNFVIIQAGSNMYGTLRSPRRSRDNNVAEVRVLVQSMLQTVQQSGAKAYWILPPHSHERLHSMELQMELAGIIKEEAARKSCPTFESLHVTQYQGSFPESDGMTLESQQYTAWANSIFNDLISKLNVSISQHTPKKAAKSTPTPKPHI